MTQIVEKCTVQDYFYVKLFTSGFAFVFTPANAMTGSVLFTALCVCNKSPFNVGILTLN